MRLYRGNNMNLSKHIEKLKNNQLTIENVLEEDDIIQDLKLNTNSQFLSILSNQNIRILIDYATKMPSSDDQKIGHKYPFNATEILCADNSSIQERLMNEMTFKESDFYDDENEKKENNEEEQKEKKEQEEAKEEKEQKEEKAEKEEEKTEEKNKKEEKEGETENKAVEGEKKPLGFFGGLKSVINKVSEEKKNETNTQPQKEKTKTQENTPEEKKDETLKKEETKTEEKKEEAKTEEKKEEAKTEEKKEEEKTEEKKQETKTEEKKEEIKTEEKKEEIKTEEKKEEATTEEKKEETKTEEEKKEEKTEEKKEEEKNEEKKEKAKTEEKKEEEKTEEKKEEEKTEEKKDETKTEEKKEEEKKEPNPEEKKSEEKKNEEKTKEPTPEVNKDDIKPEEKKEEIKEGETKLPEEKSEKKEEKESEETKPEEKKEEEKAEEENKEEKIKEKEEEEAKKENENEEENEEEEKGQHKHFPKEDEDDDNQKENEEDEDSEKDEEVKTVTVYDNIDYLFGFLNEPKETISNHVLVGYFYRILNHLISSQSIKIVQYIFDYPYKKKFDVLNAIVNNLNRKSIGTIVNKLLLFSDEANEFENKKKDLVKKLLEELEKSSEKEKYECICEVLISALNNKTFYFLFMNDQSLVDLLFSLIEKTKDNKKLICLLNLLIKVNENVLKNFSNLCTKNLAPENPLDFMNLFNYDSSYPSEDKQISNEQMDEINQAVLLTLFKNLKATKFKCLEDLGEYNENNGEFETTYHQKQKKIGMKKLAQIEFLRTILDIFVNSINSQLYEKEIEELVTILKDINIFYNCHKLFFDFPFSNIYQTFYIQIIDIVMNKSSPKYLIEYFFNYLDGKGEKKNLVSDLMEHFLNNMKFTFNSSNSSFNPCASFEITLLNKFNNTDNEDAKELLKDDNDLKVFNEVLGEEINRIYNQKLLLSDALGANLGTEDEKPLQTFGKANFMEIVEEDIDIYKAYKEGKDYKSKLNEKLEREQKEREEKEKLEQEIVGDDEENKDEQIQDENEENEEGVEGNVNEKEEGEEGDEVNNVGEENENKDEDEKEKEKEKNIEQDVQKDDKKSESTEESVEEKQYNDVNYWNPGIVPNDEIMSSILNDLE